MFKRTGKSHEVRPDVTEGRYNHSLGRRALSQRAPVKNT